MWINELELELGSFLVFTFMKYYLQTFTLKGFFVKWQGTLDLEFQSFYGHRESCHKLIKWLALKDFTLWIVLVLEKFMCSLEMNLRFRSKNTMTDVSVGIRPPRRCPVRWTSNQEVLGFILSSRLCLKKHLSHVFTRLKIHHFIFIVAPYSSGLVGSVQL